MQVRYLGSTMKKQPMGDGAPRKTNRSSRRRVGDGAASQRPEDGAASQRPEDGAASQRPETRALRAFATWGARVLKGRGLRGQLKMVVVEMADGGAGAPNASSLGSQKVKAARRAAEAAVDLAWGMEPAPADAHRDGPGPRTGKISGTEHDFFWGSSRSHSVPANWALGGVIQYVPVAAAPSPGRTRAPSPVRAFLGVDLEPLDRPVNARLRAKLCPRPENEAPEIQSGQIPLLVVWCVKEALFKADPAQEGHILADYDWTRVRRWGQWGWQGQARGVHGSQFEVAVRQVGSAWVATALCFSTHSQGR